MKVKLLAADQLLIIWINGTVCWMQTYLVFQRLWQ